MPVRNYCRDALVQHCIEAVGGDTEKAIRVLDRVVNEQRDFLVVPACIPTQKTELSMWLGKYIKSRFSAEKWVRAHVGLVNNYDTLLARAYLLTPGLVVPDSEWSRPEFVAAFDAETRRILTAKASPRTHNLNEVRAHQVAGPVLRFYEERFPAELNRYLYFYDMLVNSLNVGLPPYDIVSRFFGQREMLEYQCLIEYVESMDDHEINVPDAMGRGSARQKRGNGLWSTRDVQRCIDLLRLYCENHRHGLSRVDIGELFEAYRKREGQTKRDEQVVQQEEAKSLSVWRIRRSQSMQWRRAMGEEKWALYQRCETALKYALPSGVYSQIPRRHFNDQSLGHMMNTNLHTLCDTLSISP